MKMLKYVIVLVFIGIIATCIIANIRLKNKIPLLNDKILLIRDSLNQTESIIDSLIAKQNEGQIKIVKKVVVAIDRGRMLTQIYQPVQIDSLINTQEINHIKQEILNDSI